MIHAKSTNYQANFKSKIQIQKLLIFQRITFIYLTFISTCFIYWFVKNLTFLFSVPCQQSKLRLPNEKIVEEMSWTKIDSRPKLRIWIIWAALSPCFRLPWNHSKIIARNKIPVQGSSSIIQEMLLCYLFLKK